MSKSTTKTQNYKGKGGKGKDAARHSRGDKFSNSKRDSNNKHSSTDQAQANYVPPTNDPAFYSNNPELLRIVTNLNTFTPVGSRLDMAESTMTDDSYQSVPGILTAFIAPTIGIAKGQEADPVNLASARQFAVMRQAFTNNITAIDPPDFFDWSLLTASTFTLYGWVMRAMLYFKAYQQLNWYMPKALIEAMGIDYSDMQLHYYDYLTAMEVYKASLAQYAFPGNLPLIKKYVTLTSQVYSDGDNIKSQLYLYCPACFYQFSPYSSEEGTALEPVWLQDGLTHKLWKYEEIKQLMDRFMTAILNNPDAALMSSITIKAFPDDIFSFSDLEGMMGTTPVYDPVVLTQIQNSEFVGLPALADPAIEGPNWAIRQSNGYLVTQPHIAAPCKAKHKKIFSTFEKEVSSEYLIDTIQGKVVLDTDAATLEGDEFGRDKTWRIPIKHVAGACPLWFRITTMDNDTPTHSRPFTCTGALSVSELTKRSAFRYAPFAYVFNENTYPSVFVGVVGDIDNYFLLKDEDIERITNASIMSLLNITGDTKW